MANPNTDLVVRSVDRLAEALASMERGAAAPPPVGPKGIELTDTEWMLYQDHADYANDDFANADRILGYLKARLGYSRLEPGKTVTVNFRQQGSDILLKPFDGKKASVLAVDDAGRAWLRFGEADWRRAIELGHAYGKKVGVSPYEATVYDTVDPKKRALRVDPLDVKEYRDHIASLGYSIPAQFKAGTDKEKDEDLVVESDSAKKKKHAEPSDKAPAPEPKPEPEKAPEKSESSESKAKPDSGEDFESDGYFYDPLVRDLPDASREQYLFVIKNMPEFGLGKWSPHEEHVLQAGWGAEMQNKFADIDEQLTKLARRQWFYPRIPGIPTSPTPKGIPKTKRVLPGIPRAKRLPGVPSTTRIPGMPRSMVLGTPSPTIAPKRLTHRGKKHWRKMWKVPNVKLYAETPTSTRRRWARAFSMFMAYLHHQDTAAKQAGKPFKPSIKGWDEKKMAAWVTGKKGRSDRHAKRVAMIDSYFKTKAPKAPRVPKAPKAPKPIIQPGHKMPDPQTLPQVSTAPVKPNVSHRPRQKRAAALLKRYRTITWA